MGGESIRQVLEDFRTALSRRARQKVLSLTADTLPSNLIQLAVQRHDLEVTEMVFEKQPVIEIRRLLECKNLFEDKILYFTLQTVAGRVHWTPLGQKRFERGRVKRGGD